MRFILVFLIFFSNQSFASQACSSVYSRSHSKNIESFTRSWKARYGSIDSLHYLLLLQRLIIEKVNVSSQQFTSELLTLYGKSPAWAASVIRDLKSKDLIETVRNPKDGRQMIFAVRPEVNNWLQGQLAKRNLDLLGLIDYSRAFRRWQSRFESDLNILLILYHVLGKQVNLDSPNRSLVIETISNHSKTNSTSGAERLFRLMVEEGFLVSQKRASQRHGNVVNLTEQTLFFVKDINASNR